MAKSPTEQFRELAIELTALNERLALARFENNELRAALGTSDQRVQLLTADVVRQDKELAVLGQRLDDHLKRVELWDTRRWGLVVAVTLAVFGAAASFASGLIIATLRTTAK